MSDVLMLDLDGVLYDWHRAVYDYYREYKGYMESYRCLWGRDYLNFSPEDWKYITEVDTFYSSQFPTQDCIDFLNKVKYIFDIYYVTGRPESVKITTEQYLKRYRFPFRENLIFSADKVNTARRIKASFCVEDLLKNVEVLSKVAKTIMFAQPHNEEYWDVYPTAHTLVGVLPFLEHRDRSSILMELGYATG